MDRDLVMARGNLRDERGDSLIELIVGMTIMVVFLAMFSGTIVMISRTASHAEAVESTASDVNVAFLRLDKQVRYAASISKPGTAGAANDWYVEFLTTNTGSSKCTQLRLATDLTQLQARTWTVTEAGYSDLTAWTPYGNSVTGGGVTSASTDPPFTLITSSPTSLERLNVQLVATSGNPAVSSALDVTFTALNSGPAYQAANNSSTYTGNVCNQVARQ
jgi:type II secretory pathway pseudopilin PulG